MDLQGHLLYIDITQICGIGCAFCMYADKHKTGIGMELSTLARENLAALINAPQVKRISISGEGEPLNNIKVFREILHHFQWWQGVRVHHQRVLSPRQNARLL